MSNTAPVVSLRNVSKFFGGVKAVCDVSTDIAYGERRLFIGTNGAGKTTLFNLIAGDLPVTSGTVEIFGKNVNKLSVQQIDYICNRINKKHKSYGNVYDISRFSSCCYSRGITCNSNNNVINRCNKNG